MSLLLRVDYGRSRVLLTGDLNSASQHALLSDDAGERIEFQCDVAKACHHGSEDVSYQLLRAMRPAATIISSGDNEGRDQRYDPNVETYHFLYRSYDPKLGRWLQRDPLKGLATVPLEQASFLDCYNGGMPALDIAVKVEYDDGLLLYLYTNANPFCFTGALGKWSIPGMATIGAIYGGIIGGTYMGMRTYARYDNRGSFVSFTGHVAGGIVGSCRREFAWINDRSGSSRPGR